MPAELPDVDALLASLLQQMTRFSCLGCPQQAAQIRRELARLQSYPDDSLAPRLKQVGRQLEEEWATLYLAIADDVPAEPTRPAALH